MNEHKVEAISLYVFISRLHHFHSSSDDLKTTQKLTKDFLDCFLSCL